MRDFIQSGRLCSVRPLSATVLVLALGCNSPTFAAITAEQDALGDSSTGGEAASTGGPVVTTGETSSGATGDSAPSTAVNMIGDQSAIPLSIHRSTFSDHRRHAKQGPDLRPLYSASSIDSVDRRGLTCRPGVGTLEIMATAPVSPAPASPARWTLQQRALGLAIDLAEILHAAHEVGVVHRDVKPDNIVIEQGDRVRLLDFGACLLMPRFHQRHLLFLSLIHISEPTRPY